MTRLGKLHTINAVADTLSCGRKKVYELGKAGRLDLVKLDSKTRVTDKSLRRLLREIEKNKLHSDESTQATSATTPRRHVRA